MSDCSSDEIIDQFIESSLSSDDSLSVPSLKRPLKPKSKPPKKKVKVDNRQPPAKHWCFTWNNYDEDTFTLLDEYFSDKCSYMIYQEEIGEEGTPHLQGYMELKTKKRKQTIVNEISTNLHLEKRRGTRAAARNYCKKVDSRKPGTEPTEHGEFGPSQGKRNDLELAVELAKAEAPTDEFVERLPGSFIRYTKGINYVRQHYSSGRDFETRNYVFYGSSRAGKSRLAHEFPTVYKVPVSYSGPTWFDGYEPSYHQTVLFDDFYGGVKWTELMQLLDRYKHQVHTKGGFVNFKPKFIIFTSNTQPSKWYEKMSSQPHLWEAFTNRIDCEIRFTKHEDGVQLYYCKGSPDSFPETVSPPQSVPVRMRLLPPPTSNPAIVRRNIRPKLSVPTHRVRTDTGWQDRDDQTISNFHLIQNHQDVIDDNLN